MNLSRPYKKWQLLAILISAFFLTLNYYLGVIVSPHSVSHPIVFRDIGAALALPILGGFCFFALPIVIYKARLAILKTAISTNSPHDIAKRYADKIARLAKRYALFSFAAACVVVVLYFYTEGLFYVAELGFERNVIRFPLVLQGLYMWTAIIMSLCVIFNITTLIADFVEQHLNVELFSAEEMFPIANTVFWNILFFASGLSLVPLFWLGGEPVMKDFVIAMAIFVIMANLMFSPLLRVRQIIVKKKAKALAEFRQEKDPQARKTQLSNLGLPQKSMTRLRSSNVKNEVIKAREWPVNLHLAIRFGLLSFLPLASWVGASVLKWLIH